MTSRREVQHIWTCDDLTTLLAGALAEHPIYPGFGERICRCGLRYDGPLDQGTHVASVLAEVVAEAIADIPTHNGSPVVAENLRYAATHESMCRSWIFDVLMGLADLARGGA